MSILVTGGYGFIGSWVAKLLAARGERVTIYDIAEKNYDYLRPHADRITFVQGDILDYPHLCEPAYDLEKGVMAYGTWLAAQGG